MSVTVVHGEDSIQVKIAEIPKMVNDIRTAFRINEAYDILLFSSNSLVEKVEKGMKIEVVLKRAADSSIQSNSSGKIVKDINEFMKTKVKSTTKPIALFILKPEDLDGFNDLKISSREVEIHVAPKVKKSDLTKYFYLREPSFIAFFDGKNTIELSYERDREKIMTLLEKCKDAKFYKPTNRPVSNLKDSNNQVSSKASSVKSNNSPKSSAFQMLEKYMDEIIKKLREEKVCRSSLN